MPRFTGSSDLRGLDPFPREQDVGKSGFTVLLHKLDMISLIQKLRYLFWEFQNVQINNIGWETLTCLCLTLLSYPQNQNSSEDQVMSHRLTVIVTTESSTCDPKVGTSSNEQVVSLLDDKLLKQMSYLHYRVESWLIFHTFQTYLGYLYTIILQSLFLIIFHESVNNH